MCIEDIGYRMSRPRDAKLLALVIRDAIVGGQVYPTNRTIIDSIINRYILFDQHLLLERVLTDGYEMDDEDKNLLESLKKTIARVWVKPGEACKSIEENDSFQRAANRNVRRFSIWPGFPSKNHKKRWDAHPGHFRHLKDVERISLRLEGPFSDNASIKRLVESKLKALHIMENSPVDELRPKALFLHIGVKRNALHVTLRHKGGFLHGSVGIRWQVFETKQRRTPENEEKRLSGLLDVFMADFMTWNRRQLRLAQERLKRIGYYEAGIDGIFGINTEKAIKEYQKSRNLPRSGIVDRRTAESLGLL